MREVDHTKDWSLCCLILGLEEICSCKIEIEPCTVTATTVRVAKAVSLQRVQDGE